MKRGWAVVSGEYSDYRVHAFFTTEESAAGSLELEGVDDWGEREVEEFWIFDRPARPAFRLQSWFDVRDGAAVESQPGPNSRAHKDQPIPEWQLRADAPCSVYLDATVHPIDRPNRGPGWELTVEGTDVERVRKVFSEKRAQLLAMPWVLMPDNEVAAAIQGLSSVYRGNA